MIATDYAIRVQNLSKSYQIYDKPGDRLKQFIFPQLRKLINLPTQAYFYNFPALMDISINIQRGESVGIIGRNGSGKSTLLQIICGTLTPTSGFAQTNGRVAALLELGSGFNTEFTGRENIYFNASILGLTNVEIETSIKDIINFADIGPFIDQPVKIYSSGMVVRLAFAIIAHVNADILVIDEALAVGDALFTQKCMRFLRKFMLSGTVLFVSHDTAGIKNLCNRVVWLDKGKLILSGSPKNVCEAYLKTLYTEQQGEIKLEKIESSVLDEKFNKLKDQRSKYFNCSNLRNDLRVFQFNNLAPSFGNAGAKILSVSIHDDDNNQLAWIVGGEKVRLSVFGVAHDNLDSPIVGFFVKDRHGQILFGDNTYLSQVNIEKPFVRGSTFQADFIFMMPILPIGEYCVDVAIANGNQHEHVQHHWVYDALILKSESTSLTTGLVGVSMIDISLRTH
ncbi:MAG TPA: ABC transporter ATP-binding protein [Burkholderiaceae bacterium]|nr:ABC transporter ATP-binding protein [Burkholderiaceae bacterium]